MTHDLISFRFCLPKPYPQTINNSQELYGLAQSVVKDFVRSITYKRKLDLKGWDSEDLASEAALICEQTIQLPVTIGEACKALRHDMMNALESRKGDVHLVSLDDTVIDPEGNSVPRWSLIPASIVNPGASHTSSPLELLLKKESSHPIDQIDPSDLPALVQTLPLQQQAIIQSMYLTSPALSTRQMALALGVSKSTVDRVKLEAIASLGKIILGQLGKSRPYTVEGQDGTNRWNKKTQDRPTTPVPVRSRPKEASRFINNESSSRLRTSS